MYRLALRLVQGIHRALICILDRGAETERIGDDHREGDRSHERDKEAVLHEVLTALVPDELLRELQHVVQPSLLVVHSPFSTAVSPPVTRKGTPKTNGRSGSLKENWSRRALTPHRSLAANFRPKVFAVFGHVGNT